jgi:hypothetical protein
VSPRNFGNLPRGNFCVATKHEISCRHDFDTWQLATWQTPVPVKDIYFPAVTFCPGLIVATDVEKVFEKVKNLLENGEMSFDNLTKSE